MNLDEHVESVADFKSDNVPNIWTLEDHDVDDEKKKEEAQEEAKEHQEADAEKDTEAELEKPSFLRRLTKRYKNQGDDEKKL